MKRFLVLVLATISVCSCSHQTPNQPNLGRSIIHRDIVTSLSNENYPIKNPQKIFLFTSKEPPHAAYRIIGKAKVSKYDGFGVARKDLHDRIKKLAASIGGDGLIDYQNNVDSIEANVIAFQKILI